MPYRVQPDRIQRCVRRGPGEPQCCGGAGGSAPVPALAGDTGAPCLDRDDERGRSLVVTSVGDLAGELVEVLLADGAASDQVRRDALDRDPPTPGVGLPPDPSVRVASQGPGNLVSQVRGIIWLRHVPESRSG